MATAANAIRNLTFVISRAVMQLDELVKLIQRNISPKSVNKLPNGLICLKGGDLRAELGREKHPLIDVPLSDYFPHEYFAEKDLIYVEL